MSEQTAISWCDSTFQPWIGCTKVGPGCDHCYAETLMDTRMHRVRWGTGQPRKRTSATYWRKPLQWNEQGLVCVDCGTPILRRPDAIDCECGQAGANGKMRRRRVFCASLADVFDNEVNPAWRAALFSLTRATPNLNWLLLTKRIGNAPKMLPPDWGDGYPNVWLGATVVNQAEADRDIPKLLAIPARLRFLSCEPLLGPIDLDISCYAMGQPRPTSDVQAKQLKHSVCALDWVIAGGESGPQARPMHPGWARSLRDQCAEAALPFHFKQWGQWAPNTTIPGGDLGGELRSGMVQHLHGPGNPEGFFRAGDAYMQRMGKKRAGCLLDGREHKAFPDA